MKLPGRLGIYACAALLALMGCGSRTDGGAGALASQDAATDDDVAVAATDDATQDVATDVADRKSVV